MPLRLLLGADLFDVRLDRFFAMSSLPFLNRRRDTICEATSPSIRHDRQESAATAAAIDG